MVDDSGTVVVEYIYDTWGKLLTTTGTLASTVGVKNPYLYRGYRYDSETGLYYLQSRYYNQDFRRFINADDTGVLHLTQGDLLGSNLFAYCGNNAVMNSDPSGYFPSWFHALLVGDAIFSTLKALYMLVFKQGVKVFGAAIYAKFVALIALMEGNKYLLYAGQFVFAAIFLVASIYMMVQVVKYCYEIANLIKNVKYTFDTSRWHQEWRDHG